MNTDLQTQTEMLLKALNLLHEDMRDLVGTTMILGVVIVAALVVIAFRRR